MRLIYFNIPTDLVDMQHKCVNIPLIYAALFNTFMLLVKINCMLHVNVIADFRVTAGTPIYS